MNIASARPQVTLLDAKTGEPLKQMALPSVFLSPIRTDIVHHVHTNMAKNHRQPYGVLSHHGPAARSAGHQHSAHSWGTGRAVSRIPRISGSGTHRSGQGAIGNMCRGGHMFAPTKVWRKWHRKINKKSRRYATVSALAATALPSLVSARGHSIEKIREIPLVVSDEAQGLKKTKEAVKLLKTVGAYEDVIRVINARGLRAGRGKMRGRRYTKRRGPLVVYAEDDGIVRAFRNIPGVDLCRVDLLNVLMLAPGAHLGRFIVWTQGAFEKLDSVYGTFTKKSEKKKGWILPRYNILMNTDISRIINSEEVQAVFKPLKISDEVKRKKRNLLAKRNREQLEEINPFAEEEKRVRIEIMGDVKK